MNDKTIKSQKEDVAGIKEKIEQQKELAKKLDESLQVV